jgi:hypothetical protein
MCVGGLLCCFVVVLLCCCVMAHGFAFVSGISVVVMCVGVYDCVFGLLFR